MLVVDVLVVGTVLLDEVLVVFGVLVEEVLVVGATLLGEVLGVSGALLEDVVMDCGALLGEVLLNCRATDEVVVDGTMEEVLDVCRLSKIHPSAGKVAIVCIGGGFIHGCVKRRQTTRNTAVLSLMVITLRPGGTSA